MSRIIPDIVKGTTGLPDKADVVIIGGGIIGVSSAYFLAKRGMSVLLCEKGLIGAEQSSRNWGWVRQMGRDQAEVPLAVRSLELWRGLNQELGEETGFRQTGISVLCRNERELGEYRNWLKEASEYGVQASLLDQGQARGLLVGLQEPFHGGMHSPFDGRAEPTLATPALARGARKSGAVLAHNCAVRGIETSAGVVSAVITERGEVRTQQVILAAGAWSRIFARSLGIELPVLKVLGSVARLSGVSNLPDMPVGASNFSFRRRVDGGVTLAMRNGNIVPIVPDSFRFVADYFPQFLSSSKELKLRITRSFLDELLLSNTWPLDQETIFERMRILDPVPNKTVLRRGLAYASHAFPALKEGKVTQTWGGLIDTTPDAVPMIGPVNALPGLFLATGFSGHGFGIGPGAGEMISQMLCGNPTIVDPTPFDPKRFRRIVRSS